MFHPTIEEFSDFKGYIATIERQIPNVALARVVPPKEWRPRAGNYDDVAHFVIPNPIQQVGRPHNELDPEPFCDAVNFFYRGCRTHVTLLAKQKIGDRGIYTQMNLAKKPMDVTEFKTVAESEGYKTPAYTDFTDLDRILWLSCLSTERQKIRSMSY